MQLEFDFVWAPKFIEVGYVARLVDTDINGNPIMTWDLIEELNDFGAFDEWFGNEAV